MAHFLSSGLGCLALSPILLTSSAGAPAAAAMDLSPLAESGLAENGSPEVVATSFAAGLVATLIATAAGAGEVLATVGLEVSAAELAAMVFNCGPDVAGVIATSFAGAGLLPGFAAVLTTATSPPCVCRVRTIFPSSSGVIS